ncbi:MAG TPA: hypothetical protein VF760_04380, partial [Xanthobacteraceae bacterium]
MKRPSRSAHPRPKRRASSIAIKRAYDKPSYGREPGRFSEFRRRYRVELAEHANGLAALHAMVKGRAATLISATREVD